MNRRLLLLLRPLANRVPHLSETVCFQEEDRSMLSFAEVWNDLEHTPTPVKIHVTLSSAARQVKHKQNVMDKLENMLTEVVQNHPSTGIKSSLSKAWLGDEPACSSGAGARASIGVRSSIGVR